MKNKITYWPIVEHAIREALRSLGDLFFNSTDEKIRTAIDNSLRILENRNEIPFIPKYSYKFRYDTKEIIITINSTDLAVLTSGLGKDATPLDIIKKRVEKNELGTRKRST